MAIERIRRAIPEDHRQDINTMSMSIEGLYCFINLVPEDSSIIDAGAGVSSWFLRRYYEDVRTVEPFGEMPGKYLDAVRATCETNGLTGGSWHVDLELVPAADYVLYDYLHTGDRHKFLELAWSKCEVGMYVDDMHVKDYAKAVRAFAGGRARMVELSALEMIDRHGRWGAWLFKE